MTGSANLTTRAYEGLRRDIIAGRIPPGSALRIGVLARERDVSMSVIREALTRLSEHGLVVANPNQGFRVATLSPDDLVDLTNLRIMLETDALRRAIESGSIAWEAEVVAAHHVLATTPTFEEGTRVVSAESAVAHQCFHEALVSACGSPRLLGVIRKLSDAAAIYRSWSIGQEPDDGRDIHAEHRELMELTMSHDADGAAKALAAHYSRTTETLLAHESRRKTTAS